MNATAEKQNVSSKNTTGASPWQNLSALLTFQSFTSPAVFFISKSKNPASALQMATDFGLD
jgi:hypothetical protein